MYTNGLMLILIGWGLKHILVSAAVFGGGQAVDQSALTVSMQADIWDATIDDRLKLAELNAKMEASPEDAGDIVKEVVKLNESIGKATQEVQGQYIQKEVEAQFGSVKGAARALGLAKWMLQLKFLLDLAKIAGVFMIVLASVRIIQTEPDASDTGVAPTKNLAIASIILVLFGTFIQGILSYFS